MVLSEKFANIVGDRPDSETAREKAVSGGAALSMFP